MLVSIVFFGCIVIIWGGIILSRHKERMTMIEKGMTAEDIKTLYERSHRGYGLRAPLMWGIVLVAVGLAAIVGVVASNWYHLDDEIVPAIMALFAGIGLVVFYAIMRKKE
jgi:hypothetical protein